MSHRHHHDYGRPGSSQRSQSSQQGSLPPGPVLPFTASSFNDPYPNAFAPATASQYNYPTPNYHPAPGSIPRPSSDLGFPETTTRPLDEDFPASEYTYPRGFDRKRLCTWIRREFACPSCGFSRKEDEFRERCREHQGSVIRCERMSANTLIQSVLPCH